MKSLMIVLQIRHSQSFLHPRSIEGLIGHMTTLPQAINPLSNSCHLTKIFEGTVTGRVGNKNGNLGKTEVLIAAIQSRQLSLRCFQDFSLASIELCHFPKFLGQSCLRSFMIIIVAIWLMEKIGTWFLSHSWLDWEWEYRYCSCSWNLGGWAGMSCSDSAVAAQKLDTTSAHAEGMDGERWLALGLLKKRCLVPLFSFRHQGKSHSGMHFQFS